MKTFVSNTPPTEHKTASRQRMPIVMTGHVDHGKSTIIGRLLAETNSLPQGKLEDIKLRCQKNARPFEYAFLLDALREEQAQGITIDSARCFFRSSRRDYIIIDAPGHIEFLKNMISGAARAQAAVLVIAADEGVQENSRRHGYLLSMLGITQVIISVNKMDSVHYDREVFASIQQEYVKFLEHVGITPKAFIPVSGREGDNVVSRSAQMEWYHGPTLLASIDQLEPEPSLTDKPFRFPVQDIYKFTNENDDRRIYAGRVACGTVEVGAEVVFWPSQKQSRIASIEGFNCPVQEKAQAGESMGFTLETQLYIKPGELMGKLGDPPPQVGKHLRANLFWLGRAPMIKDKRYKLKLGAMQVPVWLRDIVAVVDASDLNTVINRDQIERHDVAECVLETLRPVACDLLQDIFQTGRFVIVDDYEIAGCGVVLDLQTSSTNRIEEYVQQREKAWDRSGITSTMRSTVLNQKSALVLLTGSIETDIAFFAKMLEEHLFQNGRYVYYLGISNDLWAAQSDTSRYSERDEYLRRLGEVSHLFTDAGLILLATVSDLEDYELELVEKLNQPHQCLVVSVGENHLVRRREDLRIHQSADSNQVTQQVQELLQRRNYLPEYYL